jgi:hypothetical protein
VPTWTFIIGEAYPQADPVARFVTVLAMGSNDWHRTMALMIDTFPEIASVDDDASGDDDPGPEALGVRLMLLRLQAASRFEATKFIDDSRRRFPEIKKFLHDLDARAQEQLTRVMAVADRHAAAYQSWLEGHRDVTTHYPELVRERHQAGKEEIANALDLAASFEGAITAGDTDNTLRFHYADAVAVNLLPDITADPSTVEELRNALIAMGRFAGLAFAAYRKAHAEVFRRVS